ncbi:MFS transporter [Brevibacterium linens]|uniref:Major facilitator superfamily MFS_1 n=1 Tax=Brevibacterium linens TaxID=1703 RepID=A0A0B9A2B0_BRELN|nr:MFS transporter [Brevibacterium linens]KHS52920.1 major facilitator superfamily MFS_1 [Brevibacterium linens]
MKAAAGVGLYFTGNGVVFAALLPWYPLLVDRLSLSSWQFGLVVACFAVGSLLSSALPAALIARFGAHRVVISGTVMLGVAASATAWSVNGVMMAVCLLLLGCCDAIVDVAQNVVGISVQERAGRTILSSMHALWSLGGLLSGAAATAAASAGADMRVWLALIGIAAVLITIVGRRLIGGYASPRRVADSDADSAVDSGIENESDSRGDDPSGSPAARGEPWWRRGCGAVEAGDSVGGIALGDRGDLRCRGRGHCE